VGVEHQVVCVEHREQKRMKSKETGESTFRDHRDMDQYMTISTVKENVSTWKRSEWYWISRLHLASSAFFDNCRKSIINSAGLR
jgi:hypothetical protein